MSLLQAAYRTYESRKNYAGKQEATEDEALVPVGHRTTKAQIEIALTKEGRLRSVQAVPKGEEMTIIPVTEESASRTSTKAAANPLSDYLSYLGGYDAKKFASYTNILGSWAHSEYTHPKVNAVWKYICGGTLMTDLQEAGLLELDEKGKPVHGKLKGVEADKYLIRWQILPPLGDEATECWRDPTLFDSFSAFYENVCVNQKKKELCLLAGVWALPLYLHPKGTLPQSYGAKLISSNDSKGFTFRGRLADEYEAGTVSMLASQKAHNSLRWLVVNHSVRLTRNSDRTFLCWSVQRDTKEPQQIMSEFVMGEDTEAFLSYRKQLHETLGSYEKTLQDDDDIIVAALEAVTKGRLSVTYYSELKAGDFLKRTEHWYNTFGWRSDRYGEFSPSLFRVARCAFGGVTGKITQSENKMLDGQVQRLMYCLLNQQPFPTDVLRALVDKANKLALYKKNERDKEDTREVILTTACAAVRKYRKDYFKEEWGLMLDKENTNRSYLYGRLLAVAEKAERSAYDSGEDRETNAIRMQAIFSQRPHYAWRIIEEALLPYYRHMKPGLREYFKGFAEDVLSKFTVEEFVSNEKLDDTYLLGYYHQRTVLNQKKPKTEKKNVEENENGNPEEQN